VRRDVIAELVLDGVLDQRLGEHGAVQMKVQLAALRHALQEFVEGKRIAANLIERFGGAKLGLEGPATDATGAAASRMAVAMMARTLPMALVIARRAAPPASGPR